MKISLLNNKEFLSGLMFAVIGAAAMYVARDYPMGSALRMGPGYFPTVLGGICIAFGLYIIVKGLRKPEALEGANWSLRALIILPLSAVIFGILMEHGGFIPAMVALVFVAAAAGAEFKFLEVLLVTIALTAACVGLFIYALGMPYPLFSGL